MQFRVLKELKKWLRKNRRQVWSLGIGAFVFLLAAIAGSLVAHRIVLPALLYDAVPVAAVEESPQPGPVHGPPFERISLLPQSPGAAWRFQPAMVEFGPNGGFVHGFYQIDIRALETWSPLDRPQAGSGGL